MTTANCSIEGCERPRVARGWCDSHYRLWKKNGDPLIKKTRTRGECSLDDCGEPHRGLGYCAKHYERLVNAGGVDIVRKPGRKPRECSIDDCEARAAGRGMCPRHWGRWRKYGDPLMPDQRPVGGLPCRISDCEAPSVARDLCSRHYAKWHRHGDPETPDRKLSAAPGECIHPDCSDLPKGRGYCPRHYERLMTHGDPDTVLSGTSGPEMEVAAFVQALGVEVRTGDRSLIRPLELDILVPSHSLAIEFNGLFWHGEGRKGRDYHRHKWALCRDQGVQLLQIWEDDWRLRRPVAERMIRHKIMGPELRLGARRTDRIDLSSAEASDFLARHHIQGPARGSNYRGLVLHDETLVAVAVIRRRPDGRGELTRFAASAQVVGGLPKLLSGLPYEELVTFADHCVSDGRLYEATGWRKDGELDPDYRYVVNGERAHKFGYRLKRFRDDPALEWREGLTERELADLNGLDRIWDAGKTRYLL